MNLVTKILMLAMATFMLAVAFNCITNGSLCGKTTSCEPDIIDCIGDPDCNFEQLSPKGGDTNYVA